MADTPDFATPGRERPDGYWCDPVSFARNITARKVASTILACTPLLHRNGWQTNTVQPWLIR